jgi:hypothetical protein
MSDATPSCTDNPGPDCTSGVNSLRRLLQRCILIRAAFLAVLVLVAGAIILPLGWAMSYSRTGILAGAVAGGVCLLAAWIALALSEPLHRRQQVLGVVLVGMLVRMGIPLAAALGVYFLGGPLADAGFLYYLVAFYPVTLTAETLLFLPECNLNKKSIRPARNLVG